SDECTAIESFPEEVRSYIARGGEDVSACDLRRYQLASRLAQLMWQYGEVRPELLRAWSKGQVADHGGSLSGTEKWQRFLWFQLIGPDGARDRAREQTGIDWILPWEIVGDSSKVDLNLPSDVHLFGFSYIWSSLLETIEYLRRQSAIHLY